MRLPPMTFVVKVVLITLGLFYVVELLCESWLGVPYFSTLALDLTGVSWATAWQWLTYPVVAPPGEAGVVAVAIGMVFLWWIVSPFELAYGQKRTIQILILGSIAGSLSALAIDQVLPGARPLFWINPATVAALCCYCWLLRGRGDLSFFGLFSLKAEALILLVVGFEVLRFGWHKEYPTLAADLGAVVAGILFATWMKRPPKRKKTKNKPPRRNHNLTLLEGGNNDEPRYLN